MSKFKQLQTALEKREWKKTGNYNFVAGGADGPAGVTLSKVSGPTKWMKILDTAGSPAYIPLYQ